MRYLGLGMLMQNTKELCAGIARCSENTDFHFISSQPWNLKKSLSLYRNCDAIASPLGGSDFAKTCFYFPCAGIRMILTGRFEAPGGEYSKLSFVLLR